MPAFLSVYLVAICLFFLPSQIESNQVKSSQATRYRSFTMTITITMTVTMTMMITIMITPCNAMQPKDPFRALASHPSSDCITPKTNHEPKRQSTPRLIWSDLV